MAEVDCIALTRKERRLVNDSRNAVALNDRLDILLFIKAVKRELKLSLFVNLSSKE